NKFDAEPCKQFADDERRKCKAYGPPRPDCAEGDAKLVRSSLCEAIAKCADRGRKEVKKSAEYQYCQQRVHLKKDDAENEHADDRDDQHPFHCFIFIA